MALDALKPQAVAAGLELLAPQPHPRQPGLRLLKTPAVIGLQHIGDRDHQVKGPGVIAIALECFQLKPLRELEQIELGQPIPLLKGRERVAARIRLGCGGVDERQSELKSAQEGLNKSHAL